MNTTLRASPVQPWTIWTAVSIANLVIACVLYTTVGWYYIRGYREVVTFLIYPVIIIQAGANLVLCCAWAGINLWRSLSVKPKNNLQEIGREDSRQARFHRACAKALELCQGLRQRGLLLQRSRRPKGISEPWGVTPRMAVSIRDEVLST